MNQEKIGEFIAELRKKKKITQEQLGKQVGVTGKAVSRWETGKSLPDISIINEVSKILNVTTTELLNGEKLLEVNHNNIGEITENSVDFYKFKLKRKFIKILTILLIMFLSLLLGTLLLFYLNNYNSCKIYSIISSNKEFSVKGIFNITNKKDILIVSQFEYFGTGITDIYAIEYRLMQEDKMYFKNGDIKSFKLDEYSKKIDFKEYLKNLTIYLENSNKKQNFNNITSKPLYVEFSYIGYGGETYNYTIPLELKKEFSNSKIIY